MKANFQETVKQKTDKELETIAKDYVFYSEEERLIALNELESRNNLPKELLISKKDIEYSQEMEEDAKKPTHRIKFKDLYPQKDYLFTPLIIYMNIFVFILMALSGVNVFETRIDTLVQWGGNIRYLTINGQVWRLFTSLFLHGGILHLVFNMFALLYVGSILEKVIGKNKFIFAYSISGIAASVSSLMMHENVVSVGASGAIFGLFGVLIPLLDSKKFNFPNISVRKMLLYNSFFVLYSISSGFGKSGIDNAAHIGGLFAGLIIGYFYCMTVTEKIRPVTIYVILVLILGIFSTLVITNVSDKYGEIYSVMKEFAVNEQNALLLDKENMAGSPISAYKDKYTKESDIWGKNIGLLEKIKNNDYDERYAQLIDMLIDYSTLRKKRCELLIESLENNSSEINQKLEKLRIDIENKLKAIRDFNK